MPTIKEILIKLGQAKARRKDLKTILSDQYKQSKDHQEAADKFAQAKEVKERIELAIRSHNPHEQEELERLKLEIDDTTTLLSDMALSMFMKGENIEVDTDSAKFEPKFKVTFTRQMKLL